MDPVKEPMCAVCGATQADAALVGRQGAGWVCAVAEPCIERSTKRAWLPITGQGGGGFVVDHGSLLVVDPLHPTGRCTCGGEGRCEWCQKICQTCGGDGVGAEAWLTCGDCNGTGWCALERLDICEKGQHSFSWRIGLEPCRYCGLPSGGELPDYEALGYPETELWSAGSDLPFNVLAGRSSWSLLADFGLIQKDIPGSTDIVDSGSSDSYK